MRMLWHFMRHRSLLYILLFLGTNLFGQTKDLSIPKYKDGELTSWYKWENERIEKLKLPDLKLTTQDASMELTLTKSKTSDFYILRRESNRR
jgi:hypothetical protein